MRTTPHLRLVEVEEVEDCRQLQWMVELRPGLVVRRARCVPQPVSDGPL